MNPVLLYDLAATRQREMLARAAQARWARQCRTPPPPRRVRAAVGLWLVHVGQRLLAGSSTRCRTVPQ